jgi:hypothetical protein
MMSDAEIFSLPKDGEIFPLSGADIVVDGSEHPVLTAHQAEIEANWQIEHAANPMLYNGQMLLHRNLRIDSSGMLRGSGHLVPYSTMLWWRKQPDRPLAEHLFPLAIPLTCDGAVLAIEMAAHTANAGHVYCAAGSLDGHDIVNGTVDLDSNMHREVAEETGIDLSLAASVSPYYGLRINRSFTVFRIYQMAFSADEAVARIRLHMEQDEEKEIAGPVIIRDGHAEGRNYAAFMPPILKSVFDGKL